MLRGALFKQFFLWMIAVNISTIIIMGLLGSILFEKGSEQAFQKGDERQLHNAAELLAEHYRYHGRWDEVIHNDTLWWGFAVPGILTPKPDGTPLSSRELLERFQSLKVPPLPKHHLPFKLLSEKGKLEHNATKNRPPKKPPLPSNSMLLFNAEGKLLKGDAALTSLLTTRIPILLDNALIGYIGRPPRPHIIENLYSSLWHSAPITLIGGIMTALLLSIGVAYWVSQTLSTPLIRISSTIRKLASGDFQKRVTIDASHTYYPIAEDVNFLGEALAESKEARQQWVSDIAHELRTPVSIMVAEIESVEYGIKPSSTDMLQSMREEIDQLNTLIGDLKTLNLSDLGGVNLERSTLSFNDFLDAYEHKIEKTVHQHEIQFEMTLDALSDEVSLFVDENRLRQVLDNLLQNTLRYTDSGGILQISTRLDGENIYLTWEDSAPAVPEHALPHLFERLYRVEKTRDRATEGSGLGLSICRSIIEALEGNIDARHSQLGGLAIDIRLPVYRNW
ncbi:ATP-binding protein [Marinibactrum halimedae]|uniref:histidine kinase n=1 Tax=Marinibactrum halimedae TaxID=1444977 RepID=A0AA37TA86_9GAMM|nr:ATP-binding protein [Marinibactrum halimedae]MCD9460811.1 ATP-binding protein [Marinibactrum halimedae]GLS26726.1 two-component sensor histidine kinase [Marinibactrum halimedae]